MSRSSSTVPQGNPDRYLRSLARPALYLDVSPEGLGPLAHRREPHAGSGRRVIKAPPVVDDLGEHGLVLGPQAHLDARRPGVAPGVGERLLQDAQQLDAHLRGEHLREPLLYHEGYATPGRELPVELDQRLDGLYERPLPLVPQVVDGATHARRRPSEGL